MLNPEVMRENKLIAVNSADNRNISSQLTKFFARIGICPKSHPSIAFDYASIIQEFYYRLCQGHGEIIDGDRYIFCTAESLVEKFPHLSVSTIARRLKKLVDFGILIAQKVKRDRCWHVLWYRIDFQFLIAQTIGIIDFATLQDRFRTIAESITNNTPLSRPNKKEKKEKKEERPGKRSEGNVSNENINNFNTNNSNSSIVANVPQVEEKINKKEQRAKPDRAYDLRLHADKSFVNYELKEMAEHKPQGDRYFQVKNQQTEIRERGKMSSVLGMSEFKSVEELRECQKQLTLYFAQKEDPQKAADRASWMIKAEKQGERSPFVEDFLNGLPIGSWCKKEWEVAPGKVAPIFRSYLCFKLRRGEDTREQVNQKINWYLKSSESLEDSWSECKRLIAIEKPRLMKAIELGQNPLSLNVPQWIIDIYRPETTVSEAADAAQTLGAIAIEQVNIQEQARKQLNPDREENQASQDGIPITIPGGITANTKIADLKCRYEEVLKQMPSSECVSSLSLEQEIDELLADPITRTRGVMLAKKHDLPVILNEEGVAIAIDYVDLEDKRKREKVDEEKSEVRSQKSEVTTQASRYGLRPPLPIGSESAARTAEPTEGTSDFRLPTSDFERSEGHGLAHQIYTPKPIEKGSKDAWEKAIAKSKFLSKIKKKSGESRSS